MSIQVQKVTVKALIVKDNAVLFVQDQKGNWELPGGCVEFGEAPGDALKRELDEELGLAAVGILGVYSVFDIQQAQGDGNTYQYIVIVFKCETDGSQIRLSSEHQKYAWFEPGKSLDLPMKAGYRTLLGELASQY